ncbi:MAG: glycosyltransferase involved in cell wall biosynthesis [Planctomycetota bacterium]|jgi:glycosyltransferase involved in cell wall biosynthesis
MRILLVSHLFPPSHSAGVEVFTAELAQGLISRGHQVAVFHTNKSVGRKDMELRRKSYKGIAVFELNNNLFHEKFQDTWDHADVDARFEEALMEFKPEVVHFHHLMYLSKGCLPLAKKHASAVLFTPHDYYLECGSMGQLVYVDGSVCERVDTGKCGTCLPHFTWRQSDLQRSVGRGLGRLHALTGLDLGPLARRLAGAAGNRAGGASAIPAEQDLPPQPAADQVALYTDLAVQRRSELLQAVTENVDRFLCPSQFLADRMQRFGLPSERVFLCPTGVNEEQFLGERQPTEATRKRGQNGRLQITFVGTVIPIKGPHLLLEAWSSLPSELRQAGELSICGPVQHAPAYVEGLRAKASEYGVELTGRLSREQVAERLAATDLLVMPSLWFENRPLVLHEALALGVPCLVSDLGGMAELVQEGRDGWHFAMGDAQALAQRLAQILADPTTLVALNPKSPDLCSWTEAAQRFETHYEQVQKS